jgi:hypothetical protein
VKKKGLKFWRHFYASSAYKGLSFVFKKVGIREASSASLEISFVMRYKERFGRGIERAYYKICGGAYFIPIFYVAFSLLLGEEIKWSLAFLYFALNLGWCFLLASMDLDRMFSLHSQILLERNSSYIQITFATRDHLQNMLQNPRLVSHHKQKVLRYQAKESWEYLQLLESLGSPIIDDAVKALGRDDIFEFEKIIHENFPDVHDEIFTEFGPLMAQHETVLYAIKKQDYAAYLNMWLNAFDNHPPFIKKEFAGTLCVTESGEIVQDDQDEDEK